MGNKCIAGYTVYYVAQDESGLVADTTTHITNKCVLSEQRARGRDFGGARVRQVSRPALRCCLGSAPSSPSLLSNPSQRGAPVWFQDCLSDRLHSEVEPVEF